jgi:hypothetical protein
MRSSFFAFFALGLAEAASSASGPCDILAAAGNPCVAAHSTTRALYAGYSGPLYNVTRAADGQSFNVGVLAPGGFANVTAHEAFCFALDCVISNVFDQSPQLNHLGQRHMLLNASQHQVVVGDGVRVYGMDFAEKGYGYHVDNTRGMAVGNEPQSIYAVMSGKRYNGACCFDYGNSEVDNTSDGAGSMEALYMGNAHWQNNSGLGEGPWVGADLECGMYYGGGQQTKYNPNSTPLPFEFVSLYLRGGTDGMVLKGGDATSGTLKTMYDGERPLCSIAGTCMRRESATTPSAQPSSARAPSPD